MFCLNYKCLLLVVFLSHATVHQCCHAALWSNTASAVQRASPPSPRGIFDLVSNTCINTESAFSQVSVCVSLHVRAFKQVNGTVSITLGIKLLRKQNTWLCSLLIVTRTLPVWWRESVLLLQPHFLMLTVWSNYLRSARRKHKLTSSDVINKKPGVCGRKFAQPVPFPLLLASVFPCACS